MALHLNLSKEAEERLRARAQELGLNLEEYAAGLLEGSMAPSGRASTGKSLLDYWEAHGVIGSRKDIRSGPARARIVRREADSHLACSSNKKVRERIGDRND